MTRPFALVPVKPLDAGKSRLAGALTDAERVALNRSLFEQTLETVASYPGPDRTIVVSRSEDLLRIAAARGMIAVRESNRADLNAALGLATEAALARGASGLLVVPVDLPLATPDRLRAIAEAESAPVLVLVPDRHGTGTNLLYQAPALMQTYRYGAGSIDRHRESGEAAGLRVVIWGDADLALDIDDPQDLAAWEVTLQVRGRPAHSHGRRD